MFMFFFVWAILYRFMTYNYQYYSFIMLKQTNTNLPINSRAARHGRSVRHPMSGSQSGLGKRYSKCKKWNKMSDNLQYRQSPLPNNSTEHTQHTHTRRRDSFLLTTLTWLSLHRHYIYIRLSHTFPGSLLFIPTKPFVRHCLFMSWHKNITLVDYCRWYMPALCIMFVLILTVLSGFSCIVSVCCETKETA